MLRTQWMAVAVAVVLGAPAASFGQASASLEACQKTMARESARYVRSVVQAVDRCVGRISADVVQNGATVATAASKRAASCATAFSRLATTGAATELGTKFDAKVGAKCAGVWDTALAAPVGEYCRTFGGDGSVDHFAEWKGCLRAAADAEARDAIATRWPRALEYLGALVALPSSGNTPARSALVALDAALEGTIDDDRPDAPAAPTGLLATGATQCRNLPEFAMVPCVRGPWDQDGAARAGFDASYTDNGDGTITDRVTGLTWEKLSADGSLHDQSDVYGYADAIDVKLAALNAGDGFAGHTDWRLPNRRELESLVDTSAYAPSIRAVFDEACTPGCSVLECSCARPAAYWTSTSYQRDPADAWVVHFENGHLVANDRGTPAHVRAVRGGTSVAAPAPAAVASLAVASVARAPASLAACQQAVARESARYLRAVTDGVGKCLDRMSQHVIGRGATPAAAAQAAAPACATTIAKLTSSASPARAPAARFDAKVAAKCDPAVNPGLSHLDADTWTIGARTLAASNLGAYCAQHDGDGTIASFAEWRDCVRSAADAQAREAIALRWPRALEYFTALGSELRSAPASVKNNDALAALTPLDAALEGATDDDRPEPRPAPPAGLLETGQTQCVQDDLVTLGPCPGGPAGQDGELRRGIARRYTDNGDGTITDEVTGLMWEKLSDDDSIHDRDHRYDGFAGVATAWKGGPHFNKVARLNRKQFAGHDDWRVPNRRELESLVDAGRVDPAIDPIFEQGCVPGCTVLECSCTAGASYFSSSVVPQPNGNGFEISVDFGDGSVGFAPDFRTYAVRAVRGGHAPVTKHVNQPPVAHTVDVKHPWIHSDYECIPFGFAFDDEDSPMLFYEMVTPPQHGYVLDDPHLRPASEVDTLPPLLPNGQIPAALPDFLSWWGPYDRPHHPAIRMPATEGLPPASPTHCYAPFAHGFIGTDSFSYRVRDQEGGVSEIETVTFTIFEAD